LDVFPVVVDVYLRYCWNPGMPEWLVFSIVLAISIIDNIYKISDAIWITIG
jgi:hypothetical protein